MINFPIAPFQEANIQKMFKRLWRPVGPDVLYSSRKPPITLSIGFVVSHIIPSSSASSANVNTWFLHGPEILHQSIKYFYSLRHNNQLSDSG